MYTFYKIIKVLSYIVCIPMFIMLIIGALCDLERYLERREYERASPEERKRLDAKRAAEIEARKRKAAEIAGRIRRK